MVTGVEGKCKEIELKQNTMLIQKKLAYVYRFVILLLLVVAIGTVAEGQERAYVTDVLRLVMRSGPGGGFDTVAIIQSGQALEITGTQGEWAEIKLPDGKEGWVLERYLVSQPTSGILLDSLNRKNQALSEQAASLREENKQFKKEIATLTTKLTQAEKELEKTTKTYEALKRDSAGFINLKRQYQKTSTELKQKTKLADDMQNRIQKLETSRTIRWVITGAGILLVGLLLGLTMRRQRRRPSLL